MVSSQRSSFEEAHLAFKSTSVPGLDGAMQGSRELLDAMIQAETREARGAWESGQAWG